MERPNQEYLLSRLSYDATSGNLIWKALPADSFTDRKWNGKLAGKTAGHLSREGYVVVYVEGKLIQAARIIWCMVTGEWPVTIVDHQDNDRSNNAWTNLRLATPSQNAMNQRLRSDNTSGLKGVCWSPRRQKWLAQIQVGRRNKGLGGYATKEEAHEAYRRANDELHGVFGRLG